MKNNLSPQLEREIESATRKIFGYGIKLVKKGSTSQADSKERLEQKQRIVKAIEREIDRKREDMEKLFKVTGNTSDGYHTFNELYEFRKVFNAALFNEWSRQGKYNVHKSKKHSDGELCFGGGWFIVMATLPTGQISNHYKMKDWDLFDCDQRELADKWDGHTAQDVLKRLRSLKREDTLEVEKGV